MFTVMGLRLEMSIPRAGSSAVSGGDLPCSGPGRDGELSISHFLLKFPPEPCMKKGRACPVTKNKLSISRFPRLYKGNQPQPCTSSWLHQSQSAVSVKSLHTCRGSPSAHRHAEPTLNQRCQTPHLRALPYKQALWPAAP